MLWMLLVLIGSFLPGPHKQAIGIVATYGNVATTDVRWQHRLLHIACFALIGLLLVLTARSPKRAVFALLGTIVFGLAIEYGQSFFYGAALEWWDIRDDSLAAVGGVLAGNTTRIRRYLLAPS